MSLKGITDKADKANEADKVENNEADKVENKEENGVESKINSVDANKILPKKELELDLDKFQENLFESKDLTQAISLNSEKVDEKQQNDINVEQKSEDKLIEKKELENKKNEIEPNNGEVQRDLDNKSPQISDLKLDDSREKYIEMLLQKRDELQKRLAEIKANKGNDNKERFDQLVAQRKEYLKKLKKDNQTSIFNKNDNKPEISFLTVEQKIAARNVLRNTKVSVQKILSDITKWYPQEFYSLTYVEQVRVKEYIQNYNWKVQSQSIDPYNLDRLIEQDDQIIKFLPLLRKIISRIYNTYGVAPTFNNGITTEEAKLIVFNVLASFPRNFVPKKVMPAKIASELRKDEINYAEKIFSVSRTKVCDTKRIVNIPRDNSCCYNAVLTGLVHYGIFVDENFVPHIVGFDGKRVCIGNHIQLRQYLCDYMEQEIKKAQEIVEIYKRWIEIYKTPENARNQPEILNGQELDKFNNSVEKIEWANDIIHMYNIEIDSELIDNVDGNLKRGNPLSFAENSRDQDVWGGDLIVKKLSEILQMKISVYVPSRSEEGQYVIYQHDLRSQENQNNNREINIRLGGSHYDLLIDTEEEWQGLPEEHPIIKLNTIVERDKRERIYPDWEKTNLLNVEQENKIKGTNLVISNADNLFKVGDFLDFPLSGKRKITAVQGTIVTLNKSINYLFDKSNQYVKYQKKAPVVIKKQSNDSPSGSSTSILDKLKELKNKWTKTKTTKSKTEDKNKKTNKVNNNDSKPTSKTGSKKSNYGYGYENHRNDQSNFNYNYDRKSPRRNETEEQRLRRQKILEAAKKRVQNNLNK